MLVVLELIQERHHDLGRHLLDWVIRRALLLEEHYQNMDILEELVLD